MGIAGILLLPLSFLYNLATRFRNHLYNIGHKKSFRFETNVIVVGNLAVGGAGKTPMVEYLIRLLSGNLKLATLSRGYKRKTKGFILAGKTDTAATIGDEPFQLYTKYGDTIAVAVGEERAWAIPNILLERGDTEVILLDDAFQHRSVTANINILVTEYHKPFFEDYVMPTGRLREARYNAKRADIIVVTKCPASLSDSEYQRFEQAIQRYTRQESPICFAAIRYLPAEPIVDTGQLLARNVLLVSGIANPQPLEDYVGSQFNLIDSIRFRDHHYYSTKDLKGILDKFKPIDLGEASIVTTEKDMVKWKSKDHDIDLGAHPIFYLPIEQYFIRNGKAFDEYVLRHLK